MLSSIAFRTGGRDLIIYMNTIKYCRQNYIDLPGLLLMNFSTLKSIKNKINGK